MQGGGGATLEGFLLPEEEWEGEGVGLLELDEEQVVVVCDASTLLGVSTGFFLAGRGLFLGGGGAGLAIFLPELLVVLAVGSLLGEECSEEESSLKLSAIFFSAAAASMVFASKSMEEGELERMELSGGWLSPSAKIFLVEGEVGVVGIGSDRLGTNFFFSNWSTTVAVTGAMGTFRALLRGVLGEGGGCCAASFS